MARELVKLSVEKDLTTEERSALQARLEKETRDKLAGPRLGRPPLHPWVKGANWSLRGVSRAECSCFARISWRA